MNSSNSFQTSYSISAELLTEREKQRREGQSRWTAVGVTVLVHLLVLGFLAWLIVGGIEDSPVELKIMESVDGTDIPVVAPPRTFDPRKPTPSGGGSMSPVIVPDAPSDVSVVETMPDTFSVGAGEAFGGGFGDLARVEVMVGRGCGFRRRFGGVAIWRIGLSGCGRMVVCRGWTGR